MRRRPPSPTCGGGRPSAFRDLVLLPSRVVAGGLVLLVLVRLTGTERGTALVLLVGALPLALLASYALLGVALGLRQRRLSAVALGLVAAHLLVVAPTLETAPAVAGSREAGRLRVVTSNLYVLNDSFVAAGRRLLALQPDVLVVPELSRAGLAGLREAGLLERLPHSVVLLAGREETVGLFSRRPLADVTTRSAGGRVLPRATVDVGGVRVRLLPAHSFPPVSLLQPLWQASLRDLSAEVGQEALPAVVAGDLNADRDHAAFRRLLATGLRDAHDERGRGLAATWPAALPLLHLDHVLVRDGEGGRLSVVDVREVRVPGSDHLAVVADLAVLPSS